MEPTRSNGLITEPKNQDSWSANLACDAPCVLSSVVVAEFITEDSGEREGPKKKLCPSRLSFRGELVIVLQGECESSLPDPVLGPRLLSCLVLPKGTFLSTALSFEGSFPINSIQSFVLFSSPSFPSFFFVQRTCLAELVHFR